MRALPDASPGTWLRAATAAEMSSGLRWYVPSGYPVLLRIFPPFELDRPIGTDWPTLEAAIERDPLAVTLPPTETAHATWAQTAARFGRTMHPLAQSHALLGVDYGSSETRIDADGWRYETHFEGRMPPAALAALARLLADQTSTPTDAVAAFWNGWSDGPAGGAPSEDAAFTVRRRRRWWPWPGHRGGVVAMPRRYVTFSAGSDDEPRRRMRRFRRFRARPGLRPGSGVEHPPPNELGLTDREHLLFATTLDEIADPTWPRRAPWAGSGSDDSPVTPSILWPADHAWVLVQEVDCDTAVLACSAETAGVVLASPDLEAAEIGYDADLGPWGDAINAP